MPVPQLTLRTEKGSDLTYAELDNNFRKLKDAFDGLEQRINISIGPDGSVDTTAVLNAVQTKMSLKVGDYIFSGVPLNDDNSRLLCNGAEVSKTTYAALAALIGGTYGAASSSSNFLLPDFRARFPLAVGTLPAVSPFTAQPVALGDNGGTRAHALSLSEMPSHDHGQTDGANMFNSSGSVNGPIVSIVTGTVITIQGKLWIKQGGTDAHGNMPPWLACYVYIRTGLAP